MNLKATSVLASILLGSMFLSNAHAGFVELPKARATPGCGKASSALIRCGGATDVAEDILYITPGTLKTDGTYNFPTMLSLINQADTSFATGSGKTFFSGIFSDYVFWDNTTNSVVIGSRLYFPPLASGDRNLAEANDIFRFGYTGFKVEAGWTRLSDRDLRPYSIASTSKGLNQGADVYNPDVVDFRGDVNASEGNPISGLYLIRTDATAFKVINNAISIRQGGEEGQSVLAVNLSGYAPTKLDKVGVAAGETIKTYGGTYTDNMNISGNLNVAYGTSQFKGEVTAVSGSRITVNPATTVTFDKVFHQQVGSILDGGGAYVFNGGYSPGNSPGAVAITGNVTFGALNDALFEIAGLLKGDDYDHLTVNGEITFGGVLRLSFINGFQAKAGDTFDLFDWTTAKGTFASISTQNALLDTGLAWNFNNLYTNGSISVVATTPVPEPETLSLLLGGLGFVHIFRKRRATKA